MNLDRAARLELFGNTYYLLFTGEAMFALTPPGKTFEPKSFIESILNAGNEGFLALCNAAQVLSEKGELARRDWGYEHGEFLTAEKIRSGAMPFDIYSIQAAVIQAVEYGIIREVPNSGKSETDVGLAKLNKKKEETA